MIRLGLEQGSPEWRKARVGLPTASQFHRIVTAKTHRYAAGAEKYLHELVAEWLLGEPLDDASSGFILRGSEMEEEAVKFYEFETGLATEKVGLCLTDDGRVGCSPDRLVGEDGGLEIKCPSPAVHVAHLLGNLADEHAAQVQGAMFVTHRFWWHLLSYHPTLPPALVRVEADTEFQGALGEALDTFLTRLDEAKRRLAPTGEVWNES